MKLKKEQRINKEAEAQSSRAVPPVKSKVKATLDQQSRTARAQAAIAAADVEAAWLGDTRGAALLYYNVIHIAS